ncbi:unnamed protein product [Rotaria sp. Silwood1]|nr:unnamed protein product [Rotaria sp. Silwood1]
MSLDLLASELKCELLNLGGDKLACDLSVENSFLSLEVLWRNSIVCYAHTKPDIQNLIKKSYHNYIAAGFPFEIIDGDNFHFHHQFLTEILNEFSSQHILVISIIGPQNSGKSTLLNYMFGTLFDVREGRCTRGIYGSLVKINKSDQMIKNILKTNGNGKTADIDYIMLIDTEGLLSIEKDDKEYGRRLVLFCLAVSHLVIVNMTGDINETLKDMLTLCADSLKQIGVNTANQPIVHFVLNQRADPNLKNHMQAILKIIGDLKEKRLAEVIDISSETFHTLPSAFKKERISTADTNSPCLLRTEPDFIERTQELCEKIIQSAKLSYERTVNIFSDPPQWLRIAVNIFDTLQKFPDLTYFKDINERRQDDQIRKTIGDLIAKKLSSTYCETIIRDTCHLTEHEIRQHFQVRFNIHQDEFDNDLENLFKVTNASDRIRDRCRQFLKRQITEFCNAWCTAAIQAHDHKQMESLVRDGSADLRHLIDDIIKRGETMTKSKATTEFQNMWARKIDSIESNFKPEERLKQAITFVYGNYNIFEKESLPSHEFVLSQLPFINRLIGEQDLKEVAGSIEHTFVDIVSKERENALEFPRNKSDSISVYTLATLHNFKHLSKQILTGLHTAGTAQQENTMMEPMESEPLYEDYNQRATENDSWFHKGCSAVRKRLGLKSSSKTSNKSSTANNPPPLRFDFMKYVHETIKNEIMTDPNAKSNIFNIPEFFHKIIDDTITIISGNDTVCRPIEIDLIQKILGLIHTYINEVNQELVIFNLLLSHTVKSSIHVHMLILITVIYFDEQKNHFLQQISILNKEKDSLLNYFISMVVPDAECDQDGAELFANKVKSIVESNLMRDGQKIITRNIEAQKNLTRKYIQMICDGKIYAAAEKDNPSLAALLEKDTLSSEDIKKAPWLVRYILAPTEIIEEEFKELWKPIEETINHQLIKEKNQWKNILLEFFNRIEFMFSSLANEGASVQYIDDIFEASGGAAADNLKNKGQCMVLLLFTYLSGNKIAPGTSYTVFDKTYTLKPKGVKLFEKLPAPSTELTNLIKGMRDADNSNNNQMVIASIKNLKYFLESIINSKSKVECSFDKAPATFAAFDKDQIYNKLLDKARGCTSKCPCCQRPCDVDHTKIISNSGDEDNRHACQTGHQLRAMAGMKFEISNEASLFQCEEMSDSKPIIFRGTKKKWSEFKNEHADWDFGNSITQEELFKLRGKLLNVWSKIGAILCKMYEMKFVTQNTPQAAPKPFHYILVLDSSGSMGIKNGKPWKDLLDGVKEFVNVRTESGSADRITIITFENHATYAYYNVDIKTIDVNNIQFMNGGTHFGNAFNLVILTIKSMEEKNSSANANEKLDYIIIFMSDGDAEYPDSQLQELLMMKERIFAFWTVALGDTKMNNLEEINRTMDGTFKELKDSADLVQIYAEIARN